MIVSASSVFSFLDEPQTFLLERTEIESGLFSVLRSRMRAIVIALAKDDDVAGTQLSHKVRCLLSEWLTVPVPFNSAMGDTLRACCSLNSVEARWGRDVRNHFDEALTVAVGLAQTGSPLRDKLCESIADLRIQERPFRIYCHRAARVHFDSLLAAPPNPPLGDEAFLHTIADYRDCTLFDTLIKVGPLRSQGWGAVPDCIVTAPRFKTLTQMVWSGCADETGFGYDPVASPVNAHGPLRRPIQWAKRTIVHRSGSGAPDNATDMDDLELFGSMRPGGAEVHPATLVQIGADRCILYPADGKVLSYDPRDRRTPINKRTPGQTLIPGTFVIDRRKIDIDLGEVKAEHGRYSRTWKERLAEEHRREPAALCKRLRQAGLDLAHLENAVERWCKPPTNVIHAPKERYHFKILIETLGLRFDSATSAQRDQHTWWQSAWNEVAKTRGVAVQAGVQEQEIVEEEILLLLNGLVHEIRERARTVDEFAIQIPEAASLEGELLFYRVLLTEEGYRVPDSELKAPCELSMAEQWRG